jgi:hydroxymethylpyrimidine kinase/phosphomethylpyrimidine kinase
MEKKVVLTIAGSDPSGGAGIQADLHAFSYLGLHGTSVITCITSQNTAAVNSIVKLSVSSIEDQIDMVLDDLSIASVKTGMLYDAQIIDLVARKLTHYSLHPIVDPVMYASSGTSLIQADFLDTLKTKLLPQTFILTPNIQEATILTGCSIKSLQDMKTACTLLHDLGPQYIILKGGHLNSSEACDLFYDGHTYSTFSLPKIEAAVHGSGCVFSALLTGLIGMGNRPKIATKKAKYLLWSMLAESQRLGKGANIINFFPRFIPPYAIQNKRFFAIWLELKIAVEKLISIIPQEYIPEVGMNFAFAIPNAQSPKDICAIAGRIVPAHGTPTVCGDIIFGGSHHIAQIILTAMAFDPKSRCALNIRFSQETIKACKHAGFNIGSFDRRKEPPTSSSTMEWGTHQVIQSLQHVPDVIYDAGGVGKEPMIRILGATPVDIIKKIQKII